MFPGLPGDPPFPETSGVVAIVVLVIAGCAIVIGRVGIAWDRGNAAAFDLQTMVCIYSD